MAAIACRTRNSDSCNRRFNSWLVTVRRGASPPPFVYYKYKGVFVNEKIANFYYYNPINDFGGDYLIYCAEVELWLDLMAERLKNLMIFKKEYSGLGKIMKGNVWTCQLGRMRELLCKNGIRRTLENVSLMFILQKI